MLEAFQKWLSEFEGSCFILSVSGGMDSMVLVSLFRQSVEPSRLVIAHFNHGVRGVESDEDEKWLKDFCKTVNLSFYSEKKWVGNSENKLRIARREFLERIQKQEKCQWIVTGHHFDDNLETLMMRLIRGSSLSGISGMRIQNGVWLKPLLPFAKKALESFATSQGIMYRTDSSNSELKYFRNRVRHTLVPIIMGLTNEFGGEGAARIRMNGLFSELRWASVKLSKEVQSIEDLAVLGLPYFVRVDTLKLRNTDAVILRALVHKILCQISHREMGRVEIQKVLSVVESKLKSVSLLGKIEVSRSYHYVYFQNEAQREAINTLRKNQNDGVRFVLPGDRFKANRKKVSRLLLKQHVPQLERKLVQVEIDSESGLVLKVLKHSSDSSWINFR